MLGGTYLGSADEGLRNVVGVSASFFGSRWRKTGGFKSAWGSHMKCRSANGLAPWRFVASSRAIQTSEVETRCRLFAWLSPWFDCGLKIHRERAEEYCTGPGQWFGVG